jgi:hypothetical protein
MGIQLRREKARRDAETRIVESASGIELFMDDYL